MGPPPFDGGNLQKIHVPDVWRQASMGPPPFDGGNPLLRVTVHLRMPRFNGATAFRRWKPEYNLPSEAIISGLQWGHRLSTVETIKADSHWLYQGTLQWGHRLSTVETSSSRATRGAGCTASMGPPPFDGGNQQTRTRATPRMNCFNGATAFRRWKLQGPIGLHGAKGDASMGPPPFDGGNFCRRDCIVGQPDASMGPPPFDGGNLCRWCPRSRRRC